MREGSHCFLFLVPPKSLLKFIHSVIYGFQKVRNNYLALPPPLQLSVLHPFEHISEFSLFFIQTPILQSTINFITFHIKLQIQLTVSCLQFTFLFYPLSITSIFFLCLLLECVLFRRVYHPSRLPDIATIIHLLLSPHKHTIVFTFRVTKKSVLKR